MNIKRKIEKLRIKLDENIDKHGLHSKEAFNISSQIDELINEWNNQQQVFDKENNMGIAYKKSLTKIKQLTIEYGEFITTLEWNKYAKENILLNNKSIEYISHLNWNQLRAKIEYEINNKNN